MTIRTHTRCMVFILLLSLLSGCFDAPAAEALTSQQESTWGLVFGQPPNTAAVVSEAPNASAAEAATMELDGSVFKVYCAQYTENTTEKAPGSVVSAGKAGIEIACADGKTVVITELQAPGKKRMRAADYLLGHPIKVED